MATATKTRSLSKTRQVINFLASGKTLSAAQANNKFGVKNLRAMISQVRDIVESHGNWQIESNTNSRGETIYSMIDTHPGSRTYGFDAQGNRYLL